MNPLIVKNLYVPKVGAGQELLTVLKEANTIWQDIGYPELKLWRLYHGPHNAVATVQRWPTVVEYEGMRARIASIPEMRSLVFDRLYPTNAAAYDTELYEEVG